jgi:type I restriction enzyme S subunit
MRKKLKVLMEEFIVPMRDKPKKFDGNIPWCRIEDIKGKYLEDSLSKRYVSEAVIKKMNLKVYPVGTLIFSCSASIGTSAIIKKPLCTNQTFIGLVPSKKIDVEFLYYYFTLLGGQFKKSASITTIPYLSRRFFEELEVDIPSNLKKQNRISKILADLDTKIELNNRMNAELEAMGKLLYDYWFVQFDFPNDNGQPYKSSGGEMVYSEVLKREVPEGWGVQSILKCCKIVDCLHSKKPDYNFVSEELFLLQLNNIEDNGMIDLTKKYYVAKQDYEKWTSRIVVQGGDIVITNAGRVAATAQIPYGLKTGIGRNITAIRPISISHTYLFLAFSGLDIQRQIISNTDVGSFFKSFNVKNIKRLHVLRPPSKLELDFENQANTIRKRKELIKQENQELTTLRDWLLPMLINGQVEVVGD